MFSDCFYVPLLRPEDNSAPGMVGEPWSPDPESPKFKREAPAENPTESPMTIRALAGPMSPTKVRLEIFVIL